jgi:hypothetical protein
MPTLLQLDIRQPAEPSGKEFLLVRHTVAVRVGELPHLVRVRLHRQHAVGAERRHPAREDQLIDEHPVCLIHAVVVPILVPRNASDGIELARRLEVLHVAAELDDEHPAVAVEGNLPWLLDKRLGQDRLDLEAGREPEARRLVGWRQWTDGRLRREIGLREVRAIRGRTASLLATLRDE